MLFVICPVYCLLFVHSVVRYLSSVLYVIFPLCYCYLSLAVFVICPLCYCLLFVLCTVRYLSSVLFGICPLCCLLFILCAIVCYLSSVLFVICPLCCLLFVLFSVQFDICPLCYLLFIFCVIGREGIAQWLERRTRDWKVAGSNPCRSDGRIFFSRVNFLCWLLFTYPFHPRVTTVARKRTRSFCQKCRLQVTVKHACTLRMWLCMKWHGAWLYGVRRTRRDGSSFMWHQPC